MDVSIGTCRHEGRGENAKASRLDPGRHRKNDVVRIVGRDDSLTFATLVCGQQAAHARATWYSVKDGPAVHTIGSSSFFFESRIVGLLHRSSNGVIVHSTFLPRSFLCIPICCNGTEDDAVKLSRTATLTKSAVGASLMLGCCLLAPIAAHAAQPQCSVEKLQGRYVFTGQGTNLHYGAFDFDGTGKFLGKQTSLRHKVALQRENLSGTYTLDADCTGTMVLEGQQGGTAHWDVFVTSDGKKGRMIRTDSGTTGVRTFEQ